MNVRAKTKTLRRKHRVKYSQLDLAMIRIWHKDTDKEGKEKIDELDFINIKIFCASKDTIEEVKRHPTD